MQNVALITGASAGIGVELARIHAEHGGDVVLVARRRERLTALADELGQAHGVRARVEAVDLAAPGAVRALCDRLQADGVAVEFLVNNAGFGGLGKFHERPWQQDEAMIRLNVLALCELTRRLVPAMVARGHGRVLNVASMAGFVPGPLQAVYYASKAFVVSFSEAIANELEGTGVTVTALCPGATATEFQQVAGLQSTRLFQRAADARSVAEVGYRGALAGKVLAVPGLGNRLVLVALRFVPRRLLTRMSRKRLES